MPHESKSRSDAGITCKHGTVGYCEPCALVDPGEEGLKLVFPTPPPPGPHQDLLREISAKCTGDRHSRTTTVPWAVWDKIILALLNAPQSERGLLPDFSPEETVEIRKVISELAMGAGNPAVHVDTSKHQTVESETLREILRRVKETVGAVRRMREGGFDLKDTERLDWLEAQATFGLRWGARSSTTGRGYRLHQDPHPEVGTHKTAREAIDAAMPGERNSTDGR